MRKVNNKREEFNGEKFSQELRAQPRKSQHSAQKHTHTHGYRHADDDGELHHSHHHEPGKNAVRMQLRSIQRFF